MSDAKREMGDVKAKHGGTHVCDRFEFGYFVYEGEKVGIHK